MFMIDMFDEKTATGSDGIKKQALTDAPKQPMLRLNIEGHSTIVRALDEEFRGTEVDFRWEGAKESIPTIKRPTIKELPDTLIIALNRFKSKFCFFQVFFCLTTIKIYHQNIPSKNVNFNLTYISFPGLFFLLQVITPRNQLFQ
jgi:hypothetical protein